MNRLVALLPWVHDNQLSGLDMGDGRILPPEDVLDGHSARLLQNRRYQQTRTIVPVQVNDAVSAAIAVLAPDLRPLADLAEEVAYAVPAVEPEPTFRQNLYDALERTRRQHLVEERLGTRAGSSSGHVAKTALISFAVGILIATTAALVITYLMRREKR